MDDINQYFREETNKRFDRIEEKIDKLLMFKWQIVGWATAVSTVIAFGISIAAIYFKV